MTDHNENRPDAGAAAAAIYSYAQRAIAVQSEFSEKLIEANRHWLEQTQIESNEAWELFRKINSTTSTAEKITGLQDWIKGVTERAAQDAIYAIETMRSLSNIELNLLARRACEAAETVRKAA
ncbi:hypothetical protein ACFFWD_00035 [Bradyrhizobium erythrophlei]|uniref:hypothetical protein n=1 Tax=Bradyrhizobium erythrophlei TaxID=1437360 RepID=UPI0035EF95B5